MQSTVKFVTLNTERSIAPEQIGVLEELVVVVVVVVVVVEEV